MGCFKSFRFSPFFSPFILQWKFFRQQNREWDQYTDPAWTHRLYRPDGKGGPAFNWSFSTSFLASTVAKANGGDGLAIACLLSEQQQHYPVSVHILDPVHKGTDDFSNQPGGDCTSYGPVFHFALVRRNLHLVPEGRVMMPCLGSGQPGMDSRQNWWSTIKCGQSSCYLGGYSQRFVTDRSKGTVCIDWYSHSAFNVINPFPVCREWCCNG